jgi:hypothetical protein
MTLRNLLFVLLVGSLPFLGVLTPAAHAQESPEWSRALTLFVPFDQTLDARFAKGDPRIMTASSMARTDGRPGNHRPDAKLLPAAGRHGGCLRITANNPQVIYYAGEKNIDWRPDDWSGTLSLWMRLDPQVDLAPGFADPIQITDKKWDDASLFLDFSKDEVPRHFRLGIFADFRFWNPDNIPYEKLPPARRPMVVVEKPPFRKEGWTHVVATWSHYNTANPEAKAVLYLDGKPQGTLPGRQTLGWNPPKTAIMLALSYIGDLDELALFDRDLTAAEVRQLFELPHGLTPVAPAASR